LVSELGEQKSLLYPTDLELLDWIYQNSPEKGQFLILDLARRNLYKRLATIYRHSKNEADWKDLLDFRRKYFGERSYIDFCENLQEQLLIHVRRRKGEIEEEARRQEEKYLTTALEEERFSRFEELMENRLCILVDIPDPERYIGADRPLLFIRETLEKRYLDPIPEGYINQIYEQLERHNKERMESLGVIRLFCHPEVRDTIRAVLNISDIIHITLQSLKRIQLL